MTPGLLDSFSLIGTLALAVPMVYAGLSLYWAGRPFGLAFVAFGVLFVLAERYVTTPSDVPREIAQKAVGGALGTESDDPGDEE